MCFEDAGSVEEAAEEAVEEGVGEGERFAEAEKEEGDALPPAVTLLALLAAAELFSLPLRSPSSSVWWPYMNGSHVLSCRSVTCLLRSSPISDATNEQCCR